VLYTSFWRVLDKVYPVWTTVGQLLEGIHSTDKEDIDRANRIKSFNAPLPAPLPAPKPATPQTSMPSYPGQTTTYEGFPAEARLHTDFSKVTGAGLCFSEAHFNVDNIKMRVFEKKSN
jgi:hypothetical protein